MSYRETARAFVRAETTGDTWSPQANYLETLTKGIPTHQASGYDPNRKALEYAMHVEATAHDLREALEVKHPGEGWAMPSADVVVVFAASRALLAAIGED